MFVINFVVMDFNGGIGHIHVHYVWLCYSSVLHLLCCCVQYPRANNNVENRWSDRATTAIVPNDLYHR